MKRKFVKLIYVVYRLGDWERKIFCRGLETFTKYFSIRADLTVNNVFIIFILNTITDNKTAVWRARFEISCYFITSVAVKQPKQHEKIPLVLMQLLIFLPTRQRKTQIY